MLCRAKVNLPEWPEGDSRDVDPTNERTQGLLRAGYIVALTQPQAAKPPTTPDVVTPEKPARASQKRPPSGDGEA